MYKFIFCIILFLVVHTQARTINKMKPTKISSVKLSDNNTVFDVNNWLYWQSNNNVSGKNPFTSKGGGIYPKNTVPLIYRDGLVIGVNLSTNDMPIRVGGRTYRTGLIPGNSTYDSNSLKIYRIRKDWKTLTSSELVDDAAVLFNVSPNDVTTDMTNDIYNQYANNWKNWPVDLGAPFVDVNKNGIYDPVTDNNGYPDATKGDYPGIDNATQVLWYVMNDNNSNKTDSLYGSKPIGFELQVTVWSFDTAPFQDVIFKKFKLKYIGQYHSKETRIGYWADFDIGYYGDDLVGCAPDLNLGFTYNGNATDKDFDPFSITPPAAGVMYLPELSSDPNIQQLHSFGYFAAGGTWGDPPMGNYDGTLSWFNLLRGNIPNTNLDSPTPFTVSSGPNYGKPTYFPFDGDPETDPNGDNSDLDGKGNAMRPGDRRMVITLPGFEMDPGDEQEFTFAILGKIGTNNLNSVTALKELAESVHQELQQPTNVKVVKADIQCDKNSAIVHAHFEINIDHSDSIAAATLIIKSQDANQVEIPLYNDGTNGDSLAGDQIWSVTKLLQTQKYPANVDLKIQMNSGKELQFPGIINDLRLRPKPSLENPYVIWENGKQDGKLNFKETAKIGFTFINNDIIFNIDETTLKLENFSNKFETQVPAGQKDSTDFYLTITAPDTGKIYHCVVSVNFDGHNVLDTLNIPLEAWEPDISWGDTLKIENISGLGKNLYPIIADPSLLNGHQYQVTFQYQDTVAKTDLFWNLKDLTTGEDKLVMQPVSEAYQPFNPIIDGIQWVLYSPSPGIEAIVEVFNAQGPLTSDEYDTLGAPYHGNNVWHSASSPNDANQFYISAGGGTGDISRIERSISNANSHDFELRFTDQDSNVYLWWYDSNQWAYVPFEFWDVGVTYNDASDDIRLLTGGYSGGGTPGQFDFANTDPWKGAPATDWIYVRKPLNENGTYQVFANDVISNTLNKSWWSNSEEVLSRITICDLGGARTLPEAGTIVRFITKKMFSPLDTILVTASLTAISQNASVPSFYELKQNYPNPFNPSTTIEFSIPKAGQVRLEIFNILGQRIRTLINNDLAPGNYRKRWDGRNNQGRLMPSGIYIYRLKNKEFSATKRMLLIR